MSVGSSAGLPITVAAKLRCRLKRRNYQNTQKIMEAEKYQITDKDGNEVLADVSGSLPLIEFIEQIEYMQGLYGKQRYTQAEAERDKLAEKLDDIMRLGGNDR